MSGQDKLEKLGKKILHARTEQVKISAITKNTLHKWPKESKLEHVNRLANLDVLQEFKTSYKQLLVQHFQGIIVDKNNLGRLFFTKLI